MLRPRSLLTNWMPWRLPAGEPAPVKNDAQIEVCWLRAQRRSGICAFRLPLSQLLNKRKQDLCVSSEMFLPVVFVTAMAFVWLAARSPRYGEDFPGLHISFCLQGRRIVLTRSPQALILLYVCVFITQLVVAESVPW